MCVFALKTRSKGQDLMNKYSLESQRPQQMQQERHFQVTHILNAQWDWKNIKQKPIAV